MADISRSPRDDMPEIYAHARMSVFSFNLGTSGMAAPPPTPRGKRQAKNSTFGSGVSKAESRRRRRNKQRKLAADRDEDSVIDLTFDDGDSDGGERAEGSSGRHQDNDMASEAGPSRQPSSAGDLPSRAGSGRAATPSSGKGKDKGKGKGKAAAPVVPNDSSEEEAGPTSFRPLSRSILTGWKLSPSRSPSPRSPQQAEIYIDEKPADPDPPDPDPTADGTGESGTTGHFDPPGLFSTSLVPSKRARRTLRKEEKRHQDQPGDAEDKDTQIEERTTEDGLLLPEHVVIESEVNGPAGTEGDEDRAAARDTEGLHILDDSQARVSRRHFFMAMFLSNHQGVTRYFDPQAGDDDTSTFLATADQSRICMNCKRPGHNQRDCPHIIVRSLSPPHLQQGVTSDLQCPTCGKEDEHERRDCPYNLICFRCGLAGHKIQVRLTVPFILPSLGVMR